MYMVVDNRLKELALLFKPYATLYAVGGFVRDSLLNIKSSDIDICSKLKAEKVKEILSGTDFIVLERNLRMGTLIIQYKELSLEYTTFRVDSYDRRSGEHAPSSVEFTEDIKLDAQRRDFKCNAVYYDILSDEIVDPLGGQKDIENKIVSTADEPDIIFEADGLRILRLVRFAAELGFEIEDKTFASAKENAWRVKDIAKERIKVELDKIFVADTRHKDLNLLDAHLKGFNLLDELGLVGILFPEINALKGIEQPKEYHLYDAYKHSLMTYYASAPSIRWAALCHDIGKAKCMVENSNMHGHDRVGEEMARDIANRFVFSNEEKKVFLFLIRYHMIDGDGKMGIGKLRRFVGENMWAMDKLVEIKRADSIGACGKSRRYRIEDVIDTIRTDGSPLSIKDLKVDGKDLINLGIEEDQRGIIMKELWADTIINPSLNNRDSAINYILRRVKKKW